MDFFKVKDINCDKSFIFENLCLLAKLQMFQNLRNVNLNDLNTFAFEG
jgi:hypothetical protein